jgi:hypothetical protein
VVVGKRNSEIATILGVSCKTVRVWLERPVVQEEIRELEADMHASTARLLAGLDRAGIQRLNTLIRTAEPKVALRAIEILLNAQSRLATMAADGLQAQVGNQPNRYIHTDEDARAALELMKQVNRERAARERERRAAIAGSTTAGS